MSSKSKCGEIRRRLGTDRLNSLPDEIIVNILSLLPFKSVIQTAVLSYRWKYLWTQIDSINIEYINSYNISDAKNLSEVFLKLISPSIKFKVRCSFGYHLIEKQSWERKASFSEICARSVEEIEIKDFSSPIAELPTCVFKTKSLVSLKLSTCYIRDYIIFPCLKKQDVQGLRPSEWYLTENLIKSCPSLEDLSLILYLHNRTEGVLSICGMNLKRLLIKFNSNFNFDGKFIIDTPKLEYLTLNTCSGSINNNGTIMAVREAHMKYYTFPIDRWCLKYAYYVAVSRVESFEINIDPQRIIPTQLSYLTRVELNQHSSLDLNFIPKGFLQILNCCPVLEILVCNFHYISEKEEDDDLSGNSPESIVAGCFSTHIKKIEINTRYIHHRIFKFIECLLCKSRVLELLIFSRAKRRRGKDNQYEELKFCKELYDCQRSSSRCQIEFSGYYVRVPKEGAAITDHVGNMIFLK